MRRQETKPKDLLTASGDVDRTVRTKIVAGRYMAVLRTPEWATEQIEHSWLGSLVFSACTCTAWTKPVNVTSRIHSKDRTAQDAPLRNLYPDEIKTSAPFSMLNVGIPQVNRTMHATTLKLPAANGHSPKSSRRRLVCARLTGISVCFLSSNRSW